MFLRKYKDKHQCIRGKTRSTEHSKGNTKTVPGKVATTRTEDEHK